MLEGMNLSRNQSPGQQGYLKNMAMVCAGLLSMGSMASAQTRPQPQLRGSGNLTINIVKKAKIMSCKYVIAEVVDSSGNPVKVFNTQSRWIGDLRNATTTIYAPRPVGYTTSVKSTVSTIKGDKLRMSCISNISNTVDTPIPFDEIQLDDIPSIINVEVHEFPSQNIFTREYDPNYVGKTRFECKIEGINPTGKIKCTFGIGETTKVLREGEVYETFARPGTYNFSAKVEPIEVPETQLFNAYTSGTGSTQIDGNTTWVVRGVGVFTEKPPKPKINLDCATGSGNEAEYSCVFSVKKLDSITSTAPAQKFSVIRQGSQTIEVEPGEYEITAVTDPAEVKGYDLTTSSTGLGRVKLDYNQYTNVRFSAIFKKIILSPLTITCQNDNIAGGKISCGGSITAEGNPTQNFNIDQGMKRIFNYPKDTNVTINYNITSVPNPGFSKTDDGATKQTFSRAPADVILGASFTEDSKNYDGILKCFNANPGLGKVSCDFTVSAKFSFGENSVQQFTLQEGQERGLTFQDQAVVKATINAVPNTGYRAVGDGIQPSMTLSGGNTIQYFAKFEPQVAPGSSSLTLECLPTPGFNNSCKGVLIKGAFFKSEDFNIPAGASQNFATEGFTEFQVSWNPTNPSLVSSPGWMSVKPNTVTPLKSIPQTPKLNTIISPRESSNVCYAVQVQFPTRTIYIYNGEANNSYDISTDPFTVTCLRSTGDASLTIPAGRDASIEYGESNSLTVVRDGRSYTVATGGPSIEPPEEPIDPIAF